MTANGLQGILAAIPTPFDDREELALDALASDIARWSETRLSGLTVLGTTGELVSLTGDERRSVLERAREATPPNKTMVAGTGAESTRETSALTRFAGELGCDYALVVTPYYHRWMFTEDTIVDHFRRVAEDSPIPVVIYHIPGCTGLEVEVETVARLSEHPNIAGIKDSSGDVFAIQEMKRQCQDGFKVLTGAAETLHAALTVGADGAILADACSAHDLCVDLLEAVADADRHRARELQDRLSGLTRVLVGQHGIPGVKALLERQGYHGGACRQPLAKLSTEATDELERLFTESNLELKPS